MTAGIAPEVFDLVVDAFGQVGGAQVGAQLSGEVEENQVVCDAFLQVFNPGFVGGAESFQEGAELALSTFGTAGGAEFLPAFLEGGVLFGAEVAPAIA